MESIFTEEELKKLINVYTAKECVDIVRELEETSEFKTEDFVKHTPAIDYVEKLALWDRVNKKDELKIFVSQPMSSITDVEFLNQFAEAIVDITKILTYLGYKKKITPVSTYMLNDSEKEEYEKSESKKIWLIARSLKFLSECDMIYFRKNWEDARGCVIEHYVSYTYKKLVLNDIEDAIIKMGKATRRSQSNITGDLTAM